MTGGFGKAGGRRRSPNEEARYKADLRCRAFRGGVDGRVARFALDQAEGRRPRPL